MLKNGYFGCSFPNHYTQPAGSYTSPFYWLISPFTINLLLDRFFFFLKKKMHTNIFKANGIFVKEVDGTTLSLCRRWKSYWLFRTAFLKNISSQRSKKLIGLRIPIQIMYWYVNSQTKRIDSYSNNIKSCTRQDEKERWTRVVIN